ncbi:hypothetical protein EWM64_g8454, partial [Hericium alpestre]
MAFEAYPHSSYQRYAAQRSADAVAYRAQCFVALAPYLTSSREYAPLPARGRAQGSYLPTPPSSATSLVPSPIFPASSIASSASASSTNVPPTVNTIALANASYAWQNGHLSSHSPALPYATRPPPVNPAPASSGQRPVSVQPATRPSPTNPAPTFSGQRSIPVQPVAGPSSTPEVEGHSNARGNAPRKDTRITKLEKRKAVDAFGRPVHPEEPAAQKPCDNTYEMIILNDERPLDCCKGVKKIMRHRRTDKHRREWAAKWGVVVPVLRTYSCHAMACDASFTEDYNMDRHHENCRIYKAEMTLKAEILKAATEAAVAATAKAEARLAADFQLLKDFVSFMTASAAPPHSTLF